MNEEKKSTKKSALSICFDFLFAILVTNNIVVFIWRVIWSTQDAIINENMYLNSWLSLVVAYIFIGPIKVLQTMSLNRKYERTLSELEPRSTQLLTPLNPNDNSGTNLISVDDASNESSSNQANWSESIKLKLFIMAFSFGNINHWRGIWYLTSLYTEDSVAGLLSVGLIALLLLTFMKRLCTLMAVPFHINTDSYEVAYEINPITSKHTFYVNSDLEVLFFSSNQSINKFSYQSEHRLCSFVDYGEDKKKIIGYETKIYFLNIFINFDFCCCCCCFLEYSALCVAI